MQLTHFIIQQELTQHCKAIILQFKKLMAKEIYKVDIRKYEDKVEA